MATRNRYGIRTTDLGWSDAEHLTMALKRAEEAVRHAHEAERILNTPGGQCGAAYSEMLSAISYEGAASAILEPVRASMTLEQHRLVNNMRRELDAVIKLFRHVCIEW